MTHLKQLLERSKKLREAAEIIELLSKTLEECQVALRGGTDLNGVFWRERTDRYIENQLKRVDQLAKEALGE